MQTREDISYGVVPFYKNDSGNWQVFLINQYSKHGGTFWSLPKGHPEDNESGEEAAKRELLEETSLVTDKLETENTIEQNYQFTWEGEMINKKVIYYIGYVTNPNFQVQPEEVATAGWFSKEDSLNQVTHKNARVVLEEAFALLGSFSESN